MKKQRILYCLKKFPQISQTYIKNEILTLQEDYDIAVIAVQEPNIIDPNHYPYKVLQDIDLIVEEIKQFKPDVLHSHYLLSVKLLHELSQRTHVPYTTRTHSFDVLLKTWIPPANPLNTDHFFLTPPGPPNAVEYVNTDNCLGIISFPFARTLLESAGINSEKINDCYPVIDYQRFYDIAPNGNAVMNMGACKPKKKMKDFIYLSSLLPEKRFNLYAMGYFWDELKTYNKELGEPTHFDLKLPEEMPAEYKKHEWLIYTGDKEIGSVGWPMAIAEAQASGVGVCAPNLRPDMKEYVGGAGFVYDSITELKDIISQPYPSEMRQIGFEHAKKSDIRNHLHVLTDLWDKCRS